MKRLIFLALACTSCQYLLPVEETIAEVIHDVAIIEKSAESKE